MAKDKEDAKAGAGIQEKHLDETKQQETSDKAKKDYRAIIIKYQKVLEEAGKN